MSGTPRRDWLADAIRAAWRRDCPSCGYGHEADEKLTCPAHAAEAVCEAVRQERLFIMPQADADGLYADVQQRTKVAALQAATEALATVFREQPIGSEYRPGLRTAHGAVRRLWLDAGGSDEEARS